MAKTNSTEFGKDVVNAEHRGKWIKLFICVGLVACTLVAYEPMRHNGFVNLDDDAYITKNPRVTGGITPDSVVWAFTQPHVYMWHPLTTLSHMLDCQLFGLNASLHHLVSLLFHIANALLVFWIFTNLTGLIWPSAFIAAVFALHPLQVESVAWAAERKTVLSGLFWFLTMAVYIWYTKRRSIRRYTLLFLIYGLCVMTKPIVVTLPFVLLLLDYWPLERLNLRGPPVEKTVPMSWLIIEKIPLFVLSAITSIITFVVQKQGGSVTSLKAFPLHFRVIIAMSSYFNYIVKILLPKNLAVFYPVQDKVETDSALLAVMGVVLLLYLWGRGRRWLIVGLLWYLGTLVPVIGLVRSGTQMMADRYMYLSGIGVFIIIAWGAEEIFSKRHYSKSILASVAASALIAMVILTRIQVGYWRDAPTLFSRAINVTQDNDFVLDCYGYYLCEQGQYDEGMRYFQEAIRIHPLNLITQKYICTAFLSQNKFDEAIGCLTMVLQESTDLPNIQEMYNQLGYAYERKGDFVQAEVYYRKTLKVKPDNEFARNSLASLLAKQGKK
jgi:hypothetical protein